MKLIQLHAHDVAHRLRAVGVGTVRPRRRERVALGVRAADGYALYPFARTVRSGTEGGTCRCRPGSFPESRRPWSRRNAVSVLRAMIRDLRAVFRLASARASCTFSTRRRSLRRRSSAQSAA
jgi:hypothetical protein